MIDSVPKYSIVVAVYNRPDEVGELLNSLSNQLFKNFEVIILEDGSTLDCKEIVDRYATRLTIHYHFKHNTGPGHTRNIGVSLARGAYIVFFDSDCIIPDDYFIKVEQALLKNDVDAWGGPDMASKDFNSLQKAISHTMTSYLTTGGIRGGKKQVSWFEPRSFNFGIKKTVFTGLGGFHYTKIGEDIDLSFRMKKGGFKSVLIADAYVYHKRRTSLAKFYKQVFIFGKSRIIVNRAHPGSIKLVHLFPLLFTLGFFSIPFISIFSSSMFNLISFVYISYFIAIGIECWVKTKSFRVSTLSMAAAWIQMIGYGTGFLKEIIKKTPRERISN
jgi:glycosyltransferase involved in cell wall biosynthesis